MQKTPSIIEKQFNPLINAINKCKSAFWITFWELKNLRHDSNAFRNSGITSFKPSRWIRNDVPAIQWLFSNRWRW